MTASEKKRFSMKTKYLSQVVDQRQTLRGSFLSSSMNMSHACTYNVDEGGEEKKSCMSSTVNEGQFEVRRIVCIEKKRKKLR